jgi:hypothetical protein
MVLFSKNFYELNNYLLLAGESKVEKKGVQLWLLRCSTSTSSLIYRHGE